MLVNPRLNELDVKLSIEEWPVFDTANLAMVMSLTRKIDNHPFTSQQIVSAKDLGLTSKQFTRLIHDLSYIASDLSLSLSKFIINRDK